MESVVILAAARSPFGRFGGRLRDAPLVDFTAQVVTGVLQRAGLEPAEVDEIVLGMVYQGGFRSNPARQVALRAGLPVTAPASLVNQQCSSGARALQVAADQIRLGRARVVVAGGMEAMSQVPFYDLGRRWGGALGHAAMRDGLLWDALVDATCGEHMGITADRVGRENGVTRAAADAYAALSQRRARAAQQAGRFTEEIVPIRTGKGENDLFAADEHPRPDTTVEGLARLAPAFQEGGLCTAGNSSGINDGAAVLVLAAESFAAGRGLPVLGRYLDSVSVSVEPERMGIGPVAAIRRLLERNGLSVDDVDLFEINEAFAAQVVACIDQLGLDREKVNVNGGAIALGHPVGATGARLVMTLLYELRRRGLKRGVASQCAGGGPAMATLVEVA